jgi:hypothetical protein
LSPYTMSFPAYTVKFHVSWATLTQFINFYPKPTPFGGNVLFLAQASFPKNEGFIYVNILFLLLL